MSVDKQTVKRVAHLARIAVSDAEAEVLKGDLNTILGFVEQLNEVDVEGVSPMTSAVDARMRMRDDVVTAGDRADDIVKNAPLSRGGYFAVPKVVE
ncbi:MAG: Asp-tRNA(Asn)/Glu-tRNA(Gln) amidotransferase subunit GatC [Alphaproteobacteria bacterium]